MRLAKDTRQTLGLAIEARIELLDAIGPDPEAEPLFGKLSIIDAGPFCATEQGSSLDDMRRIDASARLSSVVA